MKTLLGFIAAGSLFAATATSDNLIYQIIWTAGCLAVFLTTCKIYEKYYLKEEKEDRV